MKGKKEKCEEPCLKLCIFIGWGKVESGPTVGFTQEKLKGSPG